MACILKGDHTSRRRAVREPSPLAGRRGCLSPGLFPLWLTIAAEAGAVGLMPGATFGMAIAASRALLRSSRRKRPPPPPSKGAGRRSSRRRRLRPNNGRRSQPQIRPRATMRVAHVVSPPFHRGRRAAFPSRCPGGARRSRRSSSRVASRSKSGDQRRHAPVGNRPRLGRLNVMTRPRQARQGGRGQRKPFQCD
ncbi:hypothetical protein SAMN06265338_1436 [Rhodoblastus acidophilus]|uniref:Uncharacterized protein n=1 Tax=Rhodoblastus acidophilus TaxID=1074 RepID=A0A212SGZ0_RHOAC|nr:hypothetical protein SAMN06265338_1436 [Rhodoblastus acidophilus]